jgi:hypothetical protein
LTGGGAKPQYLFSATAPVPPAREMGMAGVPDPFRAPEPERDATHLDQF